MKTLIIIFCLLVLASCSSGIPEAPILVSDKPVSAFKMEDSWKMGKYTVAYYVETEGHYFITDSRALFGTKGESFGGPGTVNSFVVDSFDPLYRFVKQLKNPNEMLFYGDLVLDKKGSAYLYKNKKVILLYHASYQGKQFYIDRVRQ